MEQHNSKPSNDPLFVASFFIARNFARVRVAQAHLLPAQFSPNARFPSKPRQSFRLNDLSSRIYLPPNSLNQKPPLDHRAALA
jgi:hypothetical protein